jgi:release factor glutamine methyltransferase
VTVLEVIQRSTEFLNRRGVESPRLQVELLLAHVLGLPRMQLYLNFERILEPAHLDLLRDLVQRRARREPLQHIVGTACFCGLDFKVNRDVLIPRPETELLAEAGWKFLLQRKDAGAVPLQALDFGTGSGCLAVTVACRCPEIRVVALDISAGALAVARENAARHGVEGRVEFRQAAGFDQMPAAEAFDLILANPPYIASAEVDTLEPEVKDFDPRLALDGGADGLDYFRMLARDAGGRLRLGGELRLEFGAGQAEGIRAIFQGQGWRIGQVEKDYTGRERFLAVGRDAAKEN